MIGTDVRGPGAPVGPDTPEPASGVGLLFAVLGILTLLGLGALVVVSSRASDPILLVILSVLGVIGSFFRGNPNLQAERSTSWEVGWETDVGRYATLSALYFDNRIRGLINFDPTFTTLENIDQARIRGGEFGITLTPFDWLSTTGSWTVLEARDTVTDTPLPRRPRNVASLTARIAPEVGWFDVPRSRMVIAPELLYVSASPEGAFARYEDNGQAIGTAGKNPEGWLFNLTASLPVTAKVTAFLELRNIGNTRYEPANAFVVQGRSAIVGMRGAF